MLSRLSALMLGVACLTNMSMAQDKVIYGNDDRQDVYQVFDQLMVEVSRSTAARISPSNLKRRSNLLYQIVGSKLYRERICRNERFSTQLAVADCSGFLVGEDLLMTAGHCMEDVGDCRRFRWVFDYKVNPYSDTIEVAESAVFKCKEILATKDDRFSMMDYAVIRLDRKVEGRKPLQLRKTGKVETQRELVVIGHPSGLPSKIAGNAFVRTNHHPSYFSANLDSYGGNSGAAVVDRNTGLVEGILVRGEEDYEYSRQYGCRVSNRCRNDQCMGEEVTRAPAILKEISDLYLF